MTNSSDEIDLSFLLARAIQVVKNNAIFVIAAFIIGNLIGVAYYQTTPQTFESKMLISSDILTESYSKSLIDNLDKLIRENNVESLSQKLGLSKTQASMLGSVEIKSAIEKPEGTPEANRIYLNVEAKSRDNSIWPQLQAGLVNYLQNNEYVKIRVAHRINYNKQIIDVINVELADLEKLKEGFMKEGFSKSSKGNVVLLDPTTINTKILELSKEKVNLLNAMETINSIQVVEGFTVFSKPATPKLSLSLVAGTSFGLLVVFLFLSFKALRFLKFAEERSGGS